MQIQNLGSLRAVTRQNPTNDRAATAATLTRMRAIVRGARTDPALLRLARSIIARIPGKNFKAEIDAVQDWVKRNIRYTLDPVGIETLQTPQVTLSERHGDCDDHSILVASLLLALGHPVRFRAVKRKPYPRFCHVLTETRLGNQWVSVETTEPWPVGYYPEMVNLSDSIVRHI